MDAVASSSSRTAMQLRPCLLRRKLRRPHTITTRKQSTTGKVAPLGTSVRPLAPPVRFGMFSMISLVTSPIPRVAITK